MKPTSQPGYVWAPPGPYEVQRGHRRVLRPWRFLFLLPVLLVGFMLFGFSYLVTPDPDVTLQPGAGFATVSGKEVVLLPYQRSGTRGMLQMVTQDMFQARLAATELDTGNVLWDVQLSDSLSWQSKVLASGSWNTYVATDDGLLVIDLITGKVLARDRDIPGLSRPVTARAAYGYDASAQAIVAMQADGSLRTIALDATHAVPASPEVVRAWTGKLNAQRSVSVTALGTATKAVLSGQDTVELRAPETVPGQRLVRLAGDGGGTPVGEAVFHDGQIPLTPPPGEAEPENGPLARGSALAAGAPAGLVVVHHDRDINSKERALSVVSLETGQVTATLPTGTGTARALTSPGKRTLVYVDDTDVLAREGLVIIRPDGRANWVGIGRPDYFGNP